MDVHHRGLLAERAHGSADRRVGKAATFAVAQRTTAEACPPSRMILLRYGGHGAGTPLPTPRFFATLLFERGDDARAQCVGMAFLPTTGFAVACAGKYVLMITGSSCVT